MAPQRLYELPHEQLVRLLGVARGRGLRFADAWEEAVRPRRKVVMTTTKDPPVGCVIWPTDSRDRIAWQGAIHAAKDDIRRAYECRPATRRELAVVQLVSLLLDASDRRERARGIQPPERVRSAA